MLLTTCAVALALCQQPTRPVADVPADAPKPFAQLETMRRMFQKRIDERRGAIAGVAESEDKAPEGADDTPRGVTGELFQFTNAPTVTSSRAEYIPGLAAIFDLTVNVRAEVFDEEPKKADTETPRAAKSGDDEAWEEVARADRDTTWRTLKALGGGAAGQEEPSRRLRFANESVEALKATVLDTMWRFGHRLELERGERLAVVVEMRSATRYGIRNLYGDSTSWPQLGADNAKAAKGPPAAANDAMALDYLRTAATYQSLAQPRAAHLVFQVSAEDLKAWRSGEIDRDDMAKRTRVQSFVGPTSAGGYLSINAAR